MKKYILLVFLIILCSLSGCANQVNPDKAITNSEMPNKTDTEYEQLLNQYYELLSKFEEVPVIDQLDYFDDEVMDKFMSLLNYRESLLEEYSSGYEQYFDIPRIRIRFSEIYTYNDVNYRYVTYIPAVSHTSKVFVQSWNDDIFECAELLAVRQTPSEEYEVVDTRIFSDDSGVYTNILIKASDIASWEDSFGMCTYKLENGTFKSFNPIKESISAGNWTVEEKNPFEFDVNTNLLALEIKNHKEREIGEWFKAGYGFEGNTLTFHETGSFSQFQLVFENGMWKQKI
jgi:hypothetical protein